MRSWTRRLPYPGQVWQAEQASLNTVVKKAVRVERPFSLLVKARVDARDTRPLQFRGRILEPPLQ